MFEFEDLDPFHRELEAREHALAHVHVHVNQIRFEFPDHEY